MRWIWVVATLVSCGCSSQALGPDLGVDLGMADLVVVDLADAWVGSPIGGPCTQASDCSEGRSKVCWRKNLYNVPGNFATPGGYCSSTCSDDSDCGQLGVCVTEGSAGSFCFSQCAQPSDCRTGFACFESEGGHCYPNAGLECDPTAPAGLCPDGRACLRYTLGTGKTGYCFTTCAIGPGTCPMINGYAQQCYVWDRTMDTDLDGIPQGDKFDGPVCLDAPLNPNADGTECLSQGYDYFDECADGEECYLGNGDHRCHQLCNPTNTDGGVGDGGEGGPVVCAKGTCKDVYGLFASATPIGLCD